MNGKWGKNKDEVRFLIIKLKKFQLFQAYFKSFIFSSYSAIKKK